MIHMMAMLNSTGNSAKMGMGPTPGTCTFTLRRYCEKITNATMVGMPICTHDPTPVMVSPQPAHMPLCFYYFVNVHYVMTVK